MRATGFVGRPIAAYDPFGTTIRLSYDPGDKDNLIDDPAYVHELTHYGQNILTGLGIEHTLMFHELYYATVQILLSEPNLRLPLSLGRSKEVVSEPREHADRVFAFLSNVIGTPDFTELSRFGRLAESIRSKLLSLVYQPGAPNPFYFQFKWRGPGFGIKLADENNLFFRLDGHFIQEIHARSTEFITRLAHEQLTVDDAVTYFLFYQSNPYVLLFLAVEKLITERLGQRIFDIQDSIFLCHLCAQIALNGFGLGNELPNIGWRESGNSEIKFSYRDPGQIFLDVLSAALDQFVRPGWAVENYFDLMAASLTKLGWPQFDQIMTHTVDELLNRLIIANWAVAGNVDECHNQYQDYMSQKLADSKAAIIWLLDQYHQQNVIEFVRAPLQVVSNGIVPGPVIAGPSRYSRIVSIGQSQDEILHITPESMRGLLIAFITNKLWYSTDLTCIEPIGGPLMGSVIGCENQAHCKGCHKLANDIVTCDNPLWLQVLATYPGLSPKIN